MARLPVKDCTYFRTVRGICPHCLQIAPARVFFRNDQVWQESLCHSCTNKPALIAGDVNWYLTNILKPMQDYSPLAGSSPPKHGCPRDCGPCAWHASPCRFLSMRLADTDCNRGLSLEQLKQVHSDLIRPAGLIERITLVGAEQLPSRKLLEVIKLCRQPHAGRMRIELNGSPAGYNLEMCELLAEHDIDVVLDCSSFHRKDIGISDRQGFIDNLNRAGVKLVLSAAIVAGANENVLKDMFGLMRSNENVIEVRTETGNCNEGSSAARKGNISTDGLVRKICESSGGLLTFDDFVDMDASHPLCYKVCRIIGCGQQVRPLVAASAHSGATVRTIRVHARMNESTFDCSRTMLCPDIVLTETGRLVPACVHNLFGEDKNRGCQYA